MRKFYSLALAVGIATLTSASLEAKTLTPDQALERATATNPAPRMMKTPKAAMKLAKVVSSKKTQEEAVYVFDNNSNGFVVVSADDMFPAVLGYSDRGSVATGNVPPAFTWWLEQYAAQIEAARESGYTPDTETLSTDERPAIEPLVKSLWDQDAPYSNDVPTITASGTTKSATGCVATALAQIMYYHKYPAVGTGEISYSYTRDNNSTNKLTAQLDTMYFDWDNMLDEYVPGKYTDEQAAAVANLMYACGLAVNMAYGSSSSANTVKDVTALCENFGYSKDMKYWYREYMTSQEWEDTVYGSLSRQRPVIYSGASDSGGHSFICDGYAGDGYYHINWGWSGSSDGYFLLNLMNPSDQGTGGTGAGYNERQLIITDIHPATEGETTDYQPGIWGYKGDFTYGVYTKNDANTPNSFFIVDHESITGIYNKAPYNIQFYYGLKAVDSEGVEHFIMSTSHKDYKYGSGLARFSLSPSSLEDGQYTVSLVYLLDGEETHRNAQHENGYNHELIMTVQDGAWVAGEFAPKNPEDYPNLIVTAFKTVGPIYRNEANNFTFSVTNLSKTQDYAGDIIIEVVDKDGEVAYTTPFKQNMNAGQTMAYSMACTFDVEPGDYTVRFTNPAGVQLSNMVYPITVSEGQTEELEDSPLQFISITPTVFEPYVKIPKLIMRMTNVSGETINGFKIKRGVYKLDGTSATGKTYINTWSTVWSNNTTKNLSVSSASPDLAPGEYYMIISIGIADEDGTYVYTQVSPKVYILVDYTIEGVTFDKDELTLNLDQTATLNTTIAPEAAAEAVLTWHSEDPEVATVDENGVVTGVGIGETDIYAMAWNGIYAVSHVAVKEETPTAAQTPVASIESGTTVESDTKLELTAEDGATIYYTIDGSHPLYSETVMKYNAPIFLTQNVHILAYATHRRHTNNSEVAEFHYTVKQSGINDVEAQDLTITAVANGFAVTGVTGATTVHVYSATGLEVMPAFTIQENATVSLDKLAGGVYFVVATADGHNATLKLNKR